MSQTTASQISWHHRPIIISLAGAAAAYSVYKLFIAYNRLPPTTLHRSNATHQPHGMSANSPDSRHLAREQPDPAPDSFNNSNNNLYYLDPALEVVDETAETEGEPDHTSSANNGVRGLLYYIAQETSDRKAYIHRGIRCEICGEFPILGIRWHCLNCPDYDLCATCEAHASHPKNHVFAKVKIPLSLLSQPPKPHKLWYAGDPHKMYPSLNLVMKKKLCQESGFDESEMDALYDQFTCIANVAWDHDPSQISAAIDRRAFNRTMSSDRWENRFSPNVLLDRMFAFYDTDGNSLIGFKEFVHGMEYLRGSNRFASLRRALQGFDMDGDGYVSRADFLRLLRGKFEIQKQLIIDATEGLEIEHTQSAMDVLRSSQPISSAFNHEEIPPGEDRRPQGKRESAFGDMEPVDQAEKTVLDDDSPFFGSPRVGRERLVAALNRFEDMLHGEGQLDGAYPSGDENMDENMTEALRVMRIEPPSETTQEEPYVQDLLWHLKEDGLNTLLDPLFVERTKVEERAIATRADRRRWQKDIAEFKEKTRTNSLDALATHDFEDRTARTARLASSIVPTDHKSLERREMDLMSAPLDRLLDVSGYGIRDDAEPDAAPPHDRPQAESLPTQNESRHTRKVAPSPLRESTLVDDDDDDEAEKKPSETELREWVKLDDIDRQITTRGGEGRLSLAEVERTVVEKNLQEVRGLVKSWLEWAI